VGGEERDSLCFGGVEMTKKEQISFSPVLNKGLGRNRCQLSNLRMRYAES
jgi:hypothetical protein